METSRIDKEICEFLNVSLEKLLRADETIVSKMRKAMDPFDEDDLLKVHSLAYAVK